MIYASTVITALFKALYTVFRRKMLSGVSMEAYGGSGVDGRKQKSQARATFFLVLFLLLVPTALAISHTSNITGDVIEGTPVIEAPEIPMTVEVITESQETVTQAETMQEEPEQQIPEDEQLPDQESDETDPESQIEEIDDIDYEEDLAHQEIPAQPELPEEPEQEQNGTDPEQNKSVTEQAPEPGINETEQETNHTGENIVQEPAANETDKINITEPNNTTETISPVPCNISCGECEILDESNCTCINDQACEQPVPAIPELPEEPTFSISVDPPARVTRGTTQQFVATIENSGPGTAFSVRPYWVLPQGLQLIATDDDCDLLLPDSFCTLTGQIFVKPDIIGRKEIRIMVDYE